MKTCLYWIGRRGSPGLTWAKAAKCYEGYDYSAHNYRRVPWRVAALWLATVAVALFVGWGLGR